MRLWFRAELAAVVLAGLITATPRALSSQAPAVAHLVGLWQAKRRFGPDVRGRLVVDRLSPGGAWRASIAGRTATARLAHDTLNFILPDSSGWFRGTFDRSRGTLAGNWIQGTTVTSGMTYATPLTLVSEGSDRFVGDVLPLDDDLTFYMKVTRRPDGSLGAFLRNPERNLGRFIRLSRIELDGSSVRWLDASGKVLNEGVLHDDVMTIYIGNRGGSYDFRKLPEGEYTDFYPRGHPTGTYAYSAPLDRGDGWPVASLEDVGMSRDTISTLMQRLVNTTDDSVGSLAVHGILIARHGKLVVEEYFYGENGDKPHDTRSATKSVTTVMIGAAMQAGTRISAATPVYPVMRPGTRIDDPRKHALTLGNLLTMSSGLDCDDWGDPSAPGTEDNITQQDTNPDWYRMILDLAMKRDPGARSMYCSINPHLAGGVLARVTGHSLPDLMRELVGDPLQMQHYYMGLSPLGEGYMGGGMRFLPRDFMKLGQLYLNGGTWQGRRVLSEDWVKESTVPRYPMGTFRYGYLWWVADYPWQGRTVQGYFASGNGGNEVMVIPELDMVIATYGGNYADGASNWLSVKELIPRYVIPAVVGGR